MFFCAFSVLTLMLTVLRMHSGTLWFVPPAALLLFPFCKAISFSRTLKAMAIPVTAASFCLRCVILFFQVSELSGNLTAAAVLGACAVFWLMFFKKNSFYLSAVPSFFLCGALGLFAVAAHFFDRYEPIAPMLEEKAVLAAALLTLSAVFVCSLFASGTKKSCFSGTVLGILCSVPFLFFRSGMSHSFALFFSNLFFAGFELSAAKKVIIPDGGA